MDDPDPRRSRGRGGRSLPAVPRPGDHAALTVRQLGELGLISRLRDAASRPPASGVVVGVGDDTAVLGVTPGASLLATTDLVIEDVHFRRASSSPRDIGWKAMAVNLSDIAAMGGTPRWALVALAVPDSTEVKEVEALYGGMLDAAAPHGVVIVGGDTSASRAGWVLNVTVLGEHTGTPRLRSMARPGDAVAVTGSLGRSAAGLAVLERGLEGAIGTVALGEITAAHCRPTARVAEGAWLGARSAVHALMDCSDGVATDLGHVCRESRVAARIRVDQLPVSPAVREAARAIGADPIEWATGGGEDYELLLTCDPGAARDLADGLRAATGTPLAVIGEIVSGPAEIAWIDAAGAAVAVRAGYEHFHA
jgi:thiamine-monophosphate kinase